MSYDAEKNLRHRVILAFLLPFCIFMILLKLGLNPIIEKKRAMLSELEVLNEKIPVAQAAVNNAPVIVEKEARLTRRLIETTQNYVLISDDEFTDLNLLLYSYARRADAEISAIKENILAAEDWMDVEKNGYAFKPFSITVSASGNYSQIQRLIGFVERENPFATISAISFKVIKADPNEMKIYFQIEWPMWTKLGLRAYLPLLEK